MVADRRDVKKYINAGGDLEVRFFGRDMPMSCFVFVQISGCVVCDGRVGVVCTTRSVWKFIGGRTLC